MNRKEDMIRFNHAIGNNIVKFNGYMDNILIYEAKNYSNSFMFKGFDIPNHEDGKFIICIGDKAFKNQTEYDFILGHEMAHIDLWYMRENRKKFKRLDAVEVYCDLKSIMMLNNEKKFVEVIEYLKRTVRNEKELKVRLMFIELFMYKRVTLKSILNYINIIKE